MSDYTVAEVDAAFADDDAWEMLSDGYGPSEVTIRGEAVPVERIEGKPAVEGGGESIYVVAKVGDQFFKKTGYYQSHYGEEWDGKLSEVRPVEKTVTVYEEV